MNTMVDYIRNKVFSYPYLNSVTCFNYFKKMDNTLYLIHNILDGNIKLLGEIYLNLVCEVSTLSKNSTLYHYFSKRNVITNEMREEDVQFLNESMNYIYNKLNNIPYDIRKLKINRGVLVDIYSKFLNVLEEYVTASNKFAALNIKLEDIESVSKEQEKMNEIINFLKLADPGIFGIYSQIKYLFGLFNIYFNRIHNSYMRIVYGEAKRIVKTNIDAFPNAFQNGSRGLVKAIDYFDCEKEFSFKTYASRWVRKTILEESEKEINIIPISNSVWRKYKKFEKIKGRNHDELTNDMEYIAKHTGFSVKQVEKIYMDIDNKKVSRLDAPIYESQGKEITLLDLAKSPSTQEEKQKIDNYLKHIEDSTSKKIMNLLFGFIDESKIHNKDIRDEKVRQILHFKEVSVWENR